MKRTARIQILGLLLVMTLVLSGCKAIGRSNGSDSMLTESPVLTEAPEQTPTETATPTPDVTPTAAPIPTAAPTVSPAPTDAPQITGSKPLITKSPTGETVDVGGSAIFIAKSEGATRAIWHFVNADRTQDIEYTEAAQTFSGLNVIDGDTGTLILKNIPESLNGWRVYCHFSNAIGSSDTDSADITVNAAKSQIQNTFDYTGTFTESVASRGTITISGSPSLYDVVVDWYEGTTEYLTTFSGTFSDTGVMSYNNGVLTVRFDDGSHELRYTDGTGKLAYVDSGVAGVYWTDDQSEYNENNTFYFAKN